MLQDTFVSVMDLKIFRSANLLKQDFQNNFTGLSRIDITNFCNFIRRPEPERNTFVEL